MKITRKEEKRRTITSEIGAHSKDHSGVKEERQGERKKGRERQGELRQ